MSSKLTSFFDSNDLQRVAAEAGVSVEELSAVGKYGVGPKYFNRRTLLILAALGAVAVAGVIGGVVYWKKTTAQKTLQ